MSTTPATPRRSRSRKPASETETPAGDQAPVIPPAVEPEPEKGSQKTLYRISTVVLGMADVLTVTGDPIEAADAKTAIKLWAEGQGDDFAGGEVEAVPVRNVTRVKVGVETRRQLTIT